MCPFHFSLTLDDMISTLGSELSGGALYILNLGEPVDLSSNMIALSQLRELASLDCTIWGMDVSHSSHKAVLGKLLEFFYSMLFASHSI